MTWFGCRVWVVNPPDLFLHCSCFGRTFGVLGGLVALFWCQVRVTNPFVSNFSAGSLKRGSGSLIVNPLGCTVGVLGVVAHWRGKCEWRQCGCGVG